MKIIHSDLKHNKLKLRIEELSDLWFLSQIIEPGDKLTAKTERKLILGSKEEKHRVKKIYLVLTVQVEKLDFHDYSDVLRVSGKIVQAPEQVPLGTYHTINVQPGLTIQIEKQSWLDFQLRQIREAEKKPPELLVIVLDRDEASFALLDSRGYKMLSHIKGNVQKKRYTISNKSNFYSEVISKLREYIGRYPVWRVILASPAFWKEELLKQIKDTELKKKLTIATCFHTGEQGINEVLKREELKQVLADARASKQAALVDKLLTEIARDGKYAYGYRETMDAIQLGAVDTLLITSKLMKELRSKPEFLSFLNSIRAAESAGAKILLLDSNSSAGKQLDGLGGIAALLRFKLNR